MSDVSIAAVGLDMPEGPAMLTDGSVAFVEQLRSTASRLVGDCVETIGCAPGAWNSLVVGAAGELYAPQNTGVRTPYLATQLAAPGIQRIDPDGTVTTVVTEASNLTGSVPIRMPNDLVFAPDGRLWFTDPSHVFDPGNRSADGRIIAVGPLGAEVVAEVGPSYCNGITFDQRGEVVWVESYERVICELRDGARREVARLPDNHVPDGLAVARDGRRFIATVFSHGVTVVDEFGAVIDHILLDERAMPTNVCFDGSVLWVTDFGVDFADGPGRGRLWRVDTDAVGVPLSTGSLPPNPESS